MKAVARFVSLTQALSCWWVSLAAAGAPAAANPQQARTVACYLLAQQEQRQVADLTQCTTELTTIVILVEEHLNADPPRTEPLTISTSLLEDFALGTPTASGVRLTGRTVGEVNRFLIDVHTQYKKLKMSAGKLDRTKPDEATLAQALTDLGRSVRRVLDRQQLTEPIAAVLRGGYIVADADDDSQGKYARNDFPAVNTASIRVEFETKHFRDDESKVDYSFGGRFEISPQLSVVKQRAATGTAGGTLYMAYSNGLLVDVAPRVSFQIPAEMELSVFGTWGLTRLESLTPKLGEGDTAILTDVVENGTGRWAERTAVGVQWRYFGEDLTVVHNQKSTLNPLLDVVFGTRWDKRFQTLETVPNSTQVNVVAPGGRMFARISINLPKLFDLRADKTKSQPYSLRITVDVERPWSSADPPGGHRIFIEAGADILKLVKPGGN